MGPKKNTKAALKKAGTMVTTAAVRKTNFNTIVFIDHIVQAGQEFLKQTWGPDKLNKINAYLDASDTSDTSTDDEAPVVSSKTVSTKKTTTKTNAKPKLSKARTMKTTAKVC